MVNVHSTMRALAGAVALMITLMATVISAQTTEELLANLHSPLVKTRRQAAKKLGERRERIAVPPLMEALRQDDDIEVRQAAARSLGLLKDGAAIPALLAALKDEAGDVRQAAIVGLVNYYIERDVDFLTARRRGIQWLNPFLETYEATIVEPFTPVEPRFIEGLVEVALQDRDQHVRVVAIRALGVLRATEAIPQLGQLMLSNSYVRVEILRTFIKLGDRSAIEFIIPFLNDDDTDVRYEALTAAGLLRSDAAVQQLISVYNSSPDGKTQDLALEALALIGDPAAEDIFLANLLSNKAKRRRFGYEGVARLGDERYVERVSRDRLRERNDEVKLAQAFGLYKLGRREFVEAIVQDLQTRRRRQAYDYLLEVEAGDLYPYLTQLGLPGRKWVVEALGQIGTGEAIGKLEPLLKSTDASLVNATTLAIERIKRREAHGGMLDLRFRPRRVRS